MNLLGLAIRNVRGNRFRSLVVFLCVFGLAGFFLSATLIVRGAEDSLTRGMGRLGADILVVPAGAEAEAESAIIIGKPSNATMPSDVLAKIAAVPGVEAVSPQLYAASGNTFMVAFDPVSDFTVQPWLQKAPDAPLGRNQALCGAAVTATDGSVKLFGQTLTVSGRLDATGTGLDRAVFVTFDTARAMAQAEAASGRGSVIKDGALSAVLVRVKPGYHPNSVALAMLGGIAGISPIESPEMIGWFRNQMSGLLWSFVTILAIIWALAVAAMGLVFSMVVNERRRHIAVLRALGATRSFVFRSLLTEAVLIAAAGASGGIALGALGVFVFNNQIAAGIGVSFVFPPFSALATLVGLSLLLALATVAVAAIIPVIRISRIEPAIAMRE